MKLKVLASLKRKYGPLPLWAWATIAGGAIALWWRMHKPSSAESPTPDELALPDAVSAYGQSDTGDTGAGTAATPDASEGGELYSDNKLREAAMQLTDQLRAISEDVASAANEPPPPDEGSGDVGNEPGVDTEEPDTGAATKNPGVRWGGKTFRTKRALGAWLSQHGGSFKVWAKRHPAAARTLSGPAPKVKKRKPPKSRSRPSRPSQHRAPAKPGTGHAGARPRAARPRAGGKPTQTRPRSAPRSQPKKHRAAPRPAPRKRHR